MECCFFLLSFTTDRINIVFQGGFGVRFGNISFFSREYVFFVWFVYIYRDSVHVLG